MKLSATFAVILVASATASPTQAIEPPAGGVVVDPSVFPAEFLALSGLTYTNTGRELETRADGCTLGGCGQDHVCHYWYCYKAGYNTICSEYPYYDTHCTP
jgi:hypothetical protein